MMIDEIATRVANVRATKRGGLVGRCPVHDDSTNSLSIDVSANDHLLVHCFAGCRTEDVAAALGLALRDLFVEEVAPTVDFGDGNGRAKPVTTRYAICRRDGTRVADHVRREPGWDGSRKSLWWEGPDGSKRLPVPVTQLPLYGSQDLDGWDADAIVIIVEGEKAADALRAKGVHALGTVTGASIWPADEVLADLAGFHVLCWPDADDAGRRHLGMVARHLAGVAATVRTLTPPDGVAKGWDAADAVAEGVDPWDLIDAVPPGVTTEDAPPDEDETEPPVAPIVAELGARRLSEIPYSLLVDGRVESGIIDALYQCGAEWTLVEFKTDDVRDQADLTRLLAEEDYLAQAGRYLAAAERLLGQRPRFALCMLNYAGGVRVETGLEVT